MATIFLAYYFRPNSINNSPYLRRYTAGSTDIETSTKVIKFDSRVHRQCLLITFEQDVTTKLVI